MVRILITACILIVTGCDPIKKADKIFINGNIWTGVKNGSRADFIAISGESIMDVGHADYKHVQGPDTELIDLRGNFVVPGFIATSNKLGPLLTRNFFIILLISFCLFK